MLNTKQPKKSNTNIRYSLGNHQPVLNQITGKALKKHGPVKQKLHKNLSQLPCGVLNDWKQNASLANLMIARPHSSLIASDVSGSLSKSREKVDLSAFCKDKIKLKKVGSKRNTLSIAEPQIKLRRASGTSHSQKKWNNRSVEEDPSVLKYMLAENRKKYNLSCGDVIQSKSKCKQIVAKGKKKSLQPSTKSQTNKPTNKKSSKNQPEPQIKKFRPSNAQKSKGSTTIINFNQNQKPKKRQNKQNKRKRGSQSKSKSKGKKNSKSSKFFVFVKGEDDEKSVQDQDYPINKYVDMKKKGKKSLNIKVGLDYNYSALNIVSASSGVLGNQEFSSSHDRNEINRVLPISLDNEQSDSINMEQIKYYQDHSPLKSKKSKRFTKFKKIREQIQEQLEQQYPYLNSVELNFLTSVVLIQRKWRDYQLYKQLNQRRQIITEYFVEEAQKSKDLFKKKEKLSKEINHGDQKASIMQKTKLAESQVQQEKVQQDKKSNRDSVQGSQFSDRKPATESHRITVNYAWILSREVFPEVSYLEYRKNTLREQFQKTIKAIVDERHFKRISEKEFQLRKNETLYNYEKDLSQLKKTKHDIKKGYLKYIDCINKIKQIKNPHDPHHKIDNKYGLRKVSSDSNFLSSLYEKIFKFDKCMSQWSGGSESIEMLTKKILIRKQFFKNDKKSERRSLSDLRSAARSSYQMIKSCRDAWNNTVIVFQHTDRIFNLQNSERIQQGAESQTQTVKQFKFSSQIFKHKHSEQGQQQKRERKQEPQPSPLPQTSPKNNLKPENINKLTNSISLLVSPESLVSKIEDEIILQLTRQLEMDIHRINPVLVDIILINHPQFSQFEGVQLDENEQEDEEKSPAMHNLHRELEQIQSPRQNSQEIGYMNEEMESEKIMEYLCGLISFIKRKNWTAEIIYNVNNNQTFEAAAYLKFLRDFQIPDDEYVPIINNEKFIEWEAYYNNQNQANRALHSDVVRQGETIFHRCIFEVFLSELQKNRPYGERGRPFPWQQKYSFFTIREVTVTQLTQIFEKCLHKIQEYLIYKCGLITQKILIRNQEQLERAHEENQDRIIEMLEQDLTQSPHRWYEVEEHGLEIKLQITQMLEEALFEEMVTLMKIIRR